MSADLKKLYNLQKKAQGKDELQIEIDLILDESNPKYNWNLETWKDYIKWNEDRGNTVVLLAGDEEEGD